MYFTPNENEVARVMTDLGFDRMQAIRHLQQRHQILEAAQRQPERYPLGKSQHFA